jgi:O-succinylbenzoate synthase
VPCARRAGGAAACWSRGSGARNIALASLPGFTLPGDISASRRYFARDIIAPEVEVSADGTVEVPRAVGLGFEIDRDYVAAKTETVERFTLRGKTVSVS